MSKRKVRFDEEEKDEYVDQEECATTSRTFKSKHSLDSDEEEEDDDGDEIKTGGKPYDVLQDDDIEGQEDATIDYDEGIKMTPFNLKEEMESGHFDSHGNYFEKKDEEIRDNWIDNLDWVRIKEFEKTRLVDEKKEGESSSEEEEEEMTAADKEKLLAEIVEMLEPGETVSKALRRLGGGSEKAQSGGRKWQAKKAKVGEGQGSADKETMLKLTGLVDQLVQSGFYEAYQWSYERITHMLKPKPQADPLDIFADKIDSRLEQPTASADKAANGEGSAGGDFGEVTWEYKWSQEEGAELFGPYSSQQMLEWVEGGFFKDNVFVRKCGLGDNQFYNSKRIDFDLYT